MTAPRHLWSGNWQLDSATVADELAKRRAPTKEPNETEPHSPQPPPRRTTAARVLAWLRSLRPQPALRNTRERPTSQLPRKRLPERRPWNRRLSVALLVALVTLLSASAAYGLVSLLTDSGGQQAATVSRARPWLGVETTSSPFGGATVADVVPGSPAEAAGIEPGDVITQINGQPIATSGDITSEIAGMHAGDRVEVQVQRGPITYVMQVTLATRAAGYP